MNDDNLTTILSYSFSVLTIKHSRMVWMSVLRCKWYDIVYFKSKLTWLTFEFCYGSFVSITTITTNSSSTLQATHLLPSRKPTVQSSIS